MPCSTSRGTLEDLLGGEQVDATELVVVAPVTPGRGRRVAASTASPPWSPSVACTDRTGLLLQQRSRLSRTTFPEDRMTQKDFVVSGDGHLLEPIDLFKTRLPEHLRDRAVWEEDFEIEPFVEGGGHRVPPAAHRGLRGLDRVPATGRPAGARPRGRSRHHPRGHGPRRGRRAGDAPEPLALRALLRRPRALDRPTPASTTTTSPNGFSPYFDRICPHTAPIPLSDVADAVVGDRARVAARRLPHRPPPRDATAELLHARPRPRVGTPLSATGLQPFFHTQTGGVSVNDTEATTLKVVLEKRRPGQTSR